MLSDLASFSFRLYTRVQLSNAIAQLRFALTGLTDFAAQISFSPRLPNTAILRSFVVDMSASIKLFSLEASRSIRVAWLLEELGVEWETKNYPRINNKAPPEYAGETKSALGKAPVLHDGDLVLVESGAICEVSPLSYQPVQGRISSYPSLG